MSSRRASSASRYRAAFANILLCAIARSDACLDVVPIARLRPDSESYTFTSNFDAADQILIRDAESWAAVWRRIHGRAKPMPPLPEADFQFELIVVVAMGRQRSGGHAIRIDRAWREGETTLVLVRQSGPATGCIAAMAITSPVDIARMPAATGPVEFRFETVVSDCN